MFKTTLTVGHLYVIQNKITCVRYLKNRRLLLDDYNVMTRVKVKKQRFM